MLALFGILIAIVGALGTVALVKAAGTTHPVLAVVRQVNYGQKISADDLTIVDIQTPTPLQPIPGSQRDTIVGQYAAVPLTPGTILAQSQVTKTAVADGKQLVSVSLKAGTLPARPLQPMDNLQLVVIPDPQAGIGAGSSGPQPLAPPATFPATVFKVGTAAANGDTVVDIEVDQTDGPLVASLAAQDRLAITVVGS